ncbi:MAG: glycoside hydrolase family 36 protein, partial [bacterium]
FNLPYTPINKSHGFKTPPVGWMTWYAVQFKANETLVLENAKRLASTFGNYSDQLCLWVDWEWNHHSFTGLGEQGVDTFTPRKDAYPNGLDFVAREIKQLGLIPALWVGATNDGQRNQLLQQHPDWILAQKPEWCGQYWIDPSHPDVVKTYIPAIFKQVRDWGYQAVKWDCLSVTFDICDAFHAKFHQPTLSTTAAMRQLVQAARNHVGPDFFLLSCAGSTERDITFAMDLFNMARIGGDIFGWDEFLTNSVARVLHFYPWHNVVFYADADNLVLRREFNTLAQARSRVSFYGLTGLPVTIGDHLPELDEPRLDLLKRIMPVADIHPMDAQQKVMGNGYVLANLMVCKKFGTWNVIDLLNPRDEPLTLTLRLEAELHIETRNGQRHAVYSFWDSQFLGLHGDTLTVTVPPMDSAVLRITPVGNRPQVISTSRHITQGAIDLAALAWEETTNCLSGSSEVVTGETYRLTILLPDGYTFAALALPTGCTQTVEPTNGNLLTVGITSQQSRLVKWNLLFTNKPGEIP